MQWNGASNPNSRIVNPKPEALKVEFVSLFTIQQMKKTIPYFRVSLCPFAKDIRVIRKVTLSFGPPFTHPLFPPPSFRGISKVRTFLSNLGMKCWNLQLSVNC